MRMSHLPNLKEDLVRDLQRMLHAVNPLVREPKTFFDTFLREDDSYQIVIRADRVPRGGRRRKGKGPLKGSLKHIDPLMFPTGEDAYHTALRHVKPDTGEITNKKITLKEYYTFRCN